MGLSHKLSIYGQGMLGLNRTDWILSSYPRSGNTWLRFFFCNLISLSEWDGEEVDFPLLNQTMVAFGANNLLEPWPHSTIPRVVKTHRHYSPLFGKVRGTIGLIRDPRDVMVSYYHFQKVRKGIYKGAFKDFIRDRRFGLQSWFRHYTSWQGHWTCTVKYEELKKETFSQFNQILGVLDVSCPEDIAREAIHRSSIRNIKKIEKSTSGCREEKAAFARDGRSRQWKDYFTEEDLEYYRGLMRRFQVSIYAQSKL